MFGLNFVVELECPNEVGSPEQVVDVLLDAVVAPEILAHILGGAGVLRDLHRDDVVVTCQTRWSRNSSSLATALHVALIDRAVGDRALDRDIEAAAGLFDSAGAKIRGVLLGRDIHPIRQSLAKKAASNTGRSLPTDPVVLTLARLLVAAVTRSIVAARPVIAKY